ncbi:hypothetical protein MAR_025894 [Mya arenaria]|uniref:YqaJ viral recombinase domain-containing protein n=1 Tax=Mya arenaria TaxID=6604 RepID=A0ABY7ERF8_MYAAR|nr:hypothetical protein MAR_025894 [Mya arenaria]
MMNYLPGRMGLLQSQAAPPICMEHSNTFSFLGATSDAIVCDNGESGIVEIKCPYSARNMTIAETCNGIPE